jgi:hypothetical protein
MTWLLRLYPRVWRRRYGAEVAEMLAGRPFSLAVAIDLLAGAIDARLHPAATLAVASAQRPPTEDKTMLKTRGFVCAALAGPGLARADQWRANGTTIGGTLVLVAIWMYAHVHAGDDPYIDSLSVMTYMLPFLVSLRHTSLRNRPASVQAIFIGGWSVLLTVFMLGIGWVTTKL